MKSRRRGSILAAFLVFSASAQFRSGIELVTLPCSVVDEHGAAVSGLEREDFRVFDNGVRRIVDHVWRDDDVPLAAGFLIDASESQRDRIAEHRTAAEELARRILRKGDRSFTFTVSGGSSPLWDAVYDAAHQTLAPLTGNKALVLLTDGFDSGSRHSWQETRDELQRDGVVLYAIQYGSRFGGSYAPDLYRLVTEAGGTWFGDPAGDYGAIAARLETDLRRGYVLGFRPENLSGKLRHEVRVELVRPELTVRGRKTYFRPIHVE